jgi:DNA-binding cell septation regulator SpoVG
MGGAGHHPAPEHVLVRGARPAKRACPSRCARCPPFDTEYRHAESAIEERQRLLVEAGTAIRVDVDVETASAIRERLGTQFEELRAIISTAIDRITTAVNDLTTADETRAFYTAWVPRYVRAMVFSDLVHPLENATTQQENVPSRDRSVRRSRVSRRCDRASVARRSEAPVDRTIGDGAARARGAVTRRRAQHALRRRSGAPRGDEDRDRRARERELDRAHRGPDAHDRQRHPRVRRVCARGDRRPGATLRRPRPWREQRAVHPGIEQGAGSRSSSSSTSSRARGKPRSKAMECVPPDSRRSPSGRC